MSSLVWRLSAASRRLVLRAMSSSLLPRPSVITSIEGWAALRFLRRDALHGLFERPRGRSRANHAGVVRLAHVEKESKACRRVQPQPSGSATRCAQCAYKRKQYTQQSSKPTKGHRAWKAWQVFWAFFGPLMALTAF